MGWTSTKKSAKVSALEFIRANSWSPEWQASQGVQIVAAAETRGVVYFALKIERPSESTKAMYVENERDGSVTAALVYLVEGSATEIRWKDMDESMGPYDAGNCPADVLAVLSPLKDPAGNGKWAQNWRERQTAYKAAA